MRYLVTGGLGVIGSYITRRLMDAGREVLVLDSCDELRNEWIKQRLLAYPTANGRLTICTDFLGRPMSTDPIIGVDAVIHCAASTGIPYSVTAPEDDWERNVEGTRALLEALRKNPKPTVALSSVKPYRVNVLPLDEDTPLEPDEPYAASKAAQSMLCVAYAKSYGLPIVTFRCSNLYGPAPCHGPRHGWLTWFCISAAIGRPIEVQGTGGQSRDMLHANDVYSACMLALEHAAKLKGEVFNLGGGRDNRVTVSRAAEMLRFATGVEVVNGPARAMDDDHVYVNYGKFLRAVGWRPLMDVESGVRDVLTWALQNKKELEKLYADVR